MKNIRYMLIIGMIYFLALSKKNYSDCPPYSIVLDTLEVGVVQRTYCEFDTICDVDTFYEDSLLDLLTKLYWKSKYVGIFHIDTINIYPSTPDTIQDTPIVVLEPQPDTTEIIVKVDSSLKEPILVEEISYKYAIECSGEVCSSPVVEGMFLAFLNNLDDQSEFAAQIRSKGNCDIEDNGIFIEDSLIKKKGLYGMPGVSIELKRFLNEVETNIRKPKITLYYSSGYSWLDDFCIYDIKGRFVNDFKSLKIKDLKLYGKELTNGVYIIKGRIEKNGEKNTLFKKVLLLGK